MRQGIQTNFKHETLRKFGCYFFVLLRMAEIQRNRLLKSVVKTNEFEFSDETIIELYNHCEKHGWVEGNSFIVNPVAILNYCQGTTTYTTVAHSAKQPDMEMFPIYLKKPATGHFVLGDKTGIIWDSWEPSAESQGFPVNSYRILN